MLKRTDRRATWIEQKRNKGFGNIQELCNLYGEGSFKLKALELLEYEDSMEDHKGELSKVLEGYLESEKYLKL